VANLPKILTIKVRHLWCDVREEVWFGLFINGL
jgi:hypothetical protein